MSTFTITHKDKKSQARAGILKTKKGPIETPFFMPVATKAAVKFINSKALENIGLKAVISNALILSLKPGIDIIKNSEGIGKFMNFKGINVTDSGGFQAYSKSLFIDSDNKGILFRNPYSGEKIFMTPEKNMEIQLAINSEIAMCLDSMPLYNQTKHQIAESVEKTSLWAKRCKTHHDKLQKNISSSKRQLLFGITQGGIYKDLRESSILQLKELNFDGYSIGGLGLGESKEEEFEIVKMQKSLIPEKPCYLMGIGNPLEILKAIELGVDMFDSRMPTMSARRGTLFTSQGKLRIFNSKFSKDKNPIDKNCRCLACKNYSRAYIKFLLQQDEPVGKELASIHNIYFITKLIEEAKKAIKTGKFDRFKKKIRKKFEEPKNLIL